MREVMFDKARKQTLAESISELLLSERGPQDRPLTEHELANHFGTSRGPVREALKELEREGFIERRKGKGICLRKLSTKDIAAVYDVRSVSEGLGGRLAAERVKEEDLRELEKIGRRCDEGREGGDSKKAEEADFAFHRRIMELSGNSYLLRMMDNFSLLERSFSLGRFLGDLPRKKTSRYSHELIVGALRKGDAGECERVMRIHIQEAKQRLIERVLRTKLNHYAP